MIIPELRLPQTIAEHGQQQVEKGLYVDLQDYIVSTLRHAYETSQHLHKTKPKQTPPSSPDEGMHLLIKITNIVPGSDCRLTKITKNGDVLKLVGHLDHKSSYIGITTKLDNYDKRFKSTAWFFVRELHPIEDPADFPQRDQRAGWLNSWWFPIQPSRKEGIHNVYEIHLRSMVEAIKLRFNHYQNLTFQGISTLRYGPTLKLNSISIYLANSQNEQK